ncbi:hypothetical protein evm_000691 [Chilo suppressalis]|nr:hypothetical protein evm_000691 [Chilo suppressalis]
MKVVPHFMVLLMLGCARADMAGECDLAGFYTELGCTPTPSGDNSTLCPDSFTCPELHPDPAMCYYRGIAYSDKSTIPQNLINNPCSQACSCRVASSGGPRFECAAVDCVEVFDSDLRQCVSTYDLEACCSTGNVCGNDAIANLKTCEVDGKSYREGESFEPKNTHKTCICTAGWDGSTDNPSVCRDINCGIEIHYQNKLLDNCAPVFVGNKKSCPISFACPSETTKIVRGVNLRGINAQCVFGNTTLGVGDEVTVDERCTTCSCEVPPFVSCTMKAACN